MTGQMTFPFKLIIVEDIRIVTESDHPLFRNVQANYAAYDASDDT